jgi:hypothetical protein
VAVVAVVISVLALLFTLASFWWLHARRGSLVAANPETYAFVDGFRLRFPLAFFNDGAIPLLVTDLRMVVSGVGEVPWTTTRSQLRPESVDEPAFPTPFAVGGRDTKELVVEFGEESGWLPDPGARHDLRLEAKTHPEDSWQEIASFEWWAPPTADVMHRYITHRNAAPTTADSPEQTS